MYPLIEVTAVAALAMYGVLRGARRHFDLVGICYIAFAVVSFVTTTVGFCGLAIGARRQGRR